MISWLKDGFSAQRERSVMTYFLHVWVTIMFLFRLLQSFLAGWLRRFYPKTPTGLRLAWALNPFRMYIHTYTVCACAYGHNLCTHCI